MDIPDNRKNEITDIITSFIFIMSSSWKGGGKGVWKGGRTTLTY